MVEDENNKDLEAESEDEEYKRCKEDKKLEQVVVRGVVPNGFWDWIKEKYKEASPEEKELIGRIQLNRDDTVRM